MLVELVLSSMFTENARYRFKILCRFQSWDCLAIFVVTIFVLWFIYKHMSFSGQLICCIIINTGKRHVNISATLAVLKSTYYISEYWLLAIFISSNINKNIWILITSHNSMFYSVCAHYYSNSLSIGDIKWLYSK